MKKTYTSFLMLTSILMIFLLTQTVFSDSIKDGILIRENSPITLKDGTVIECERFYWLVSTADYIQYDKDGRSIEIPIDDVDIEKTFGPEIAKEYSEAEEELKKEYEKIKKERETGVVSDDEASTPETDKKKPSKKKKKAADKKKKTKPKKK